MVATRLLALSGAFFILTLHSGAFAQDNPDVIDPVPNPFPSLDDLEVEFFTTEVQFTDVLQEAAGYATEYYDNVNDRGSLILSFQGEVRSIYFDNTTFQITEVVDSNCTVTDEDTFDFNLYNIFPGWVYKGSTLVIGPSAALWYAQDKKTLLNYVGKEEIRTIACDHYELPLLNKKENLTLHYYFAMQGWQTAYNYRNLRIPVRIRATGVSNRYSINPTVFAPVDQISDFAYFRPTVEDKNDLLPPIGLGCSLKEETDDFPTIPTAFQYSAEVVNLLDAKQHDEVEIQFQQTWYDHDRQIARMDRYSKAKGYKSSLFDFNTGTVYKIQNDGSCRMTILLDEDFEVYDYGATSRMMEPKEALYLDGEFYEMGEREIRGLTCDVYESVQFNEYFQNKRYYKLVVTVYFTKSGTNVGFEGETESRVPVYLLINGWSSPKTKTLQLQYNIFEFKDKIWPEMYSTFRLQDCYTKAETKAYFLLIMEVSENLARAMENNDAYVVFGLRKTIAEHAKVPDMRIPFLKVDYKPTGVYATGVLLERPPALLQFRGFDPEPTVSHDDHLTIAMNKNLEVAKNLEECAYACIDAETLCKGFYHCNDGCYLKSTDPTDDESGEERNLGICTDYWRAEIDSTNFRQSYLDEALGNLETAVLNQTVKLRLELPGAEEDIINVQDIAIGDGPYTGVDAGDKPFTVSVELRKLDPSVVSNKKVEYTSSLHDCYKRCKEAGSGCASFSFCPDSPKDDKECMITENLVMKGLIKDDELLPSKYCNVYNLKFLDYFIAFPEKLSLLPGDKVVRSVEALEKCAHICRMEESFKCRGFEYCRSMKTCTLHKKHILDLKPGETATVSGRSCVHYAAQYTADYMDMGYVLIDDKSNVRQGTTLDECAKICSEELGEGCKSFNYCPAADFGQSSCALSSKLLRDDGITTTVDSKCSHYEKRDTVHDWNNAKAKGLSATGYTKKGFAGLVVGMLALGLIVGALVFVLYSYMRSRSSGEGMAVRFMKNET